MTLLKISAKNLNPNVNYVGIDRELFLNQNPIKEVSVEEINQLKEKAKTYRRIIQISVSMLAVIMTPSMVFAAPEAISVDSINELGKTLSMIAVGVSVSLSTILLSIAGMYRMLRKKKEAKEWSQDIIKGLFQSLAAVPCVYLIYQLAQAFFSEFINY
jgi:hypothetical protein